MKVFKQVLCLIICTIFGNIEGYSQTDSSYLKDIRNELRETWPNNRTINIVFHGHSVPSGYFVTPDVRKFESYPHLALEQIKEKYPTAVVNSITTSIGGEHAETGENRFTNEVLSMRPDVLFIDYALNDRGIGLERAKTAWQKMIDASLNHSFTSRGGETHQVKVILMTPTPDTSEEILSDDAVLAQHSAQIRQLAIDNKVGLIDSYALFKEIASRESLSSYMAQGNHVNAKGHQVVADEIAKHFVQEETVANGLYFIKGLFTGRFMTVENASEDTNALIIVEDSANTENQKFWIRNTTTGYSISPYHSDKALGLLESSTQNGINLVQVDSTGSNNERFTLSYATDDHYWIVNKHSTKYVATPGTQNENGTPVIQWVFFNNLNYRWKFIPAEKPDMENEITLTKQSIENQIEVYPNPAQSVIRIVREDTDPINIKLMSLEGKELSWYKLNATESDLRIPETLGSGVYLLEFSGEEDSFVKRVIIE